MEGEDDDDAWGAVMTLRRRRARYVVSVRWLSARCRARQSVFEELLLEVGTVAISEIRARKRPRIATTVLHDRAWRYRAAMIPRRKPAEEPLSWTTLAQAPSQMTGEPTSDVAGTSTPKPAQSRLKLV